MDQLETQKADYKIKWDDLSLNLNLFEPQVGLFEPQVGPFEPQVAPFEPLVGPFETPVEQS